jgi:hypothetical protein
MGRDRLRGTLSILDAEGQRLEINLYQIYLDLAG